MAPTRRRKLRLRKTRRRQRGGTNPLLEAIEKGDYIAVSDFIREKSDLLNKTDEIGDTPLHKAAWYGGTDIVRKLIKAGANPNAKSKNNWTPLHYAAVRGKKEVVRVLIEKGNADVNAKSTDGNTPLHWAAREGHLAVVEQLLGYDADIKAVNNHGLTPLNLGSKHTKVAQFLISKGADVSHSSPSTSKARSTLRSSSVSKRVS
jgi:ankyrin repeat protein